MNLTYFKNLGLAILFALSPIVLQAQEETNGYTLLWHVNYNLAKGTQSSPAIAKDGTVYLGMFDGRLVAYTTKGKTHWEFRTGSEIHSSPAVGPDGTVYFGSRDRNLYAVGPDGKLKWKFATGGWVDSSPGIGKDGTLYAGSWDKNLYALQPDGKLKWKFDAHGIVYSSPAIATNGTIYFGSHDSNLYALQPDGSMKWKFTTGGPINASPTIGMDGAVYFTSTDGNLYALEPDGRERWRLHTGGYTPSTAVLDEEGNIYVNADKDYYFISPAGKVLVDHHGEVPVDVSPAATANREVVFSIPWLRVGSFFRDHPWPPHFFHIDSNLTGSPNIGDDGTIYANSGLSFYAIKPPNPAPPAKSSWPLWRCDPQQTGRAK
jgi:outer membrane protein assembly factor BamB